MHTIVFAMTALSLIVLWHPVGEGQGQPPVSQAPITPVAGQAEASPLDEPLAWLAEARRNYAAVKDYTCTLVSRENVRGKMRDENIMQMKMKTQPFSVYMKWVAPREFQGQEVAFVVGRNNNKMRVKSNIIAGKLIGFMSIDPNDSRVLEHSRHNILEAGIGNMIEQTSRHWEIERKVGKIDVKLGTYKFDGRECQGIETIRAERHANSYSHRCVIFLEKQSKMPVRLENYDFPTPGGPPGGELMESFSYLNLQFNTGLRDEDFNK